MQFLTLTGNVGRDPELRTTQDGDTVCSFSVGSKQGWARDAKTEWFRCSVWGKRGQSVADNLRKGMKVTVVGEFTIGEYQGKPQYEIRVSEVDWPPAGNRDNKQAGTDKDGWVDSANLDLSDEVPF